MRLISCHIENFGKLCGYDRVFNEGCNMIMASNGQGKSTLAAFIRVMFYGFEGEGKRKAGENERKRYEPWQGGVYGGRLTFDDGDKAYVISRTFGAKSSDDTFELRDAATNLISAAYSENVGEELFGVNAESYMRTAYIGQNDVVTHTTDGINKRIGGIVDSTNDLDSYNNAMTKLNDLLNKSSLTRSTGSLYKLEEEVTTLRTKVREGSVVRDSIHRLEDSMEARRREMESLIGKRADLSDRQSKLAAYKDVQALKDKWQSVRDEVKERTEEAEVRRVAFPGKLPSEEDITKYQSAAGEYDRLNEGVTYYSLSGEESDKFKTYEEKFSVGMPDMNETTELIRAQREHDISLRDEAGKKAELKGLRSNLEAAVRSGRTLPVSAIAGMGVIMAAMITAVAAMFLMPSNALRLTGVVIAGVILIVGVVVTIMGIRRNRLLVEEDKAVIEDEIKALEKEIAEGEDFRTRVVSKTKAYLDRYSMKLDPVSVTDDLRHLHIMADEYKRLKDKKAGYDRAVEDRDGKKKVICDYLASLDLKPEEDITRQLNRLSGDLRSYKEALGRKETAEKKLKDFEDSNDMSRIEAIRNDQPDADTKESLEEIGKKINDISEKIDEIAGYIRNESSQHDVLQEKLEAWEEDQASLADKEQKLLEGKHRLKLLKYSAEYLETAKESITAKYMEPLLTGFSKYYSSVTGTDADMYRIDANTNITVEELGSQRDTALLSTGYQDLIGFCLRLSLIDAMYGDKKPVLVLDDPFVNLDAERLKGANRLTDTLSKEYQMIYFTCR